MILERRGRILGKRVGGDRVEWNKAHAHIVIVNEGVFDGGRGAEVQAKVVVLLHAIGNQGHQRQGRLWHIGSAHVAVFVFRPRAILILRTSCALRYTFCSASQQDTLTGLSPSSPYASHRPRSARTTQSKLIISSRASDIFTSQRELLFLFAGVVSRFITSSLIQLWKSIPESVSKIGRTTVLFLKDGILDDGGPDSAVFLIAGLERAIFFFGEGTSAFTPGLFEQGRAIGEGGANFGGEVGTRVGIVFFISVGKVGAESALCVRVNVRKERDKTDLSLRSTGERLSKVRVGSLRMVFQLPTPC